MVCSSTQLDRWNLLLGQNSPCQPLQYNEDEPESESDGSISDSMTRHQAGYRRREKEGVYRDRSLSDEFRAFLADHGMEAPDGESSESESSLLESSYSDEVRRLLRSDQSLSTSLQAVLDGEEPAVCEESNSSTPVLGERSSNTVSSCNSSIATVDTLTEESESNTTVQLYLKEDSENQEPVGSLVNTRPAARRGLKRRSITEGGPQTAVAVVTAVQNSNSIVFETDL